MYVKRRNTDFEYQVYNLINKLPHFQNSPSHFTN